MHTVKIVKMENGMNLMIPMSEKLIKIKFVVKLPMFYFIVEEEKKKLMKKNCSKNLLLKLMSLNINQISIQ